MKFYHSLPVQIRFNDVDLARHVNNSVYQEYFDLGRLSYFKDVFGLPMNFDGLSLVIASFRVDFFQPVNINDQIRVLTKVVSFGTKSLEMVQQIMQEGIATPKAESVSVLVCFDYMKQASEAIPVDWKTRIMEFEQFEVTGNNTRTGS